MEILSQGEKIKRIRKSFKIRQQDITGGEITRELISIIENNKTNLTPNVAQIIADNINRICKERGIEFSVEASYLLEDVSQQSNKIADEYIEFLSINENEFSQSLIEEIDHIEFFCMKYGEAEKNLILYEKIGDIYNKQRSYDKSYTYYIKALENAASIDETIALIKVSEKIGVLCLKLMKYEETLHFNSFALRYEEHLSKDLKRKLLLNNILAYVYLKEYHKALEEAENIINIFSKQSVEELFEVNMIRVHCLRQIKEFNSAIKLSKTLLEQVKDSDLEKKITTLTNMLDIYSALKDYKNIKVYLKKITGEINKYEDLDNNPNSPRIYAQIGAALVLLQDIDKAKECYDKVISLCKKQRDSHVLDKALDEYFNLLLLENNSENIDDFKNNVLELISHGLIAKNNINIAKLIKYYNSVEDRESIDNLLTFILES